MSVHLQRLLVHFAVSSGFMTNLFSLPSSWQASKAVSEQWPDTNRNPVESLHVSHILALILDNHHKKKIDKGIDFLRGGEKKMVSIFRLRRCGKVAVS